MRAGYFVSLLLIAVAAASADAQLRTWTDDSGKFSVRAEYQTSANGHVTLKTEDGRTILVPLGRLSIEDQRLVDLVVRHQPNVIDGEVMAITDGDTLIVLDEKKTQYKIRLEGIDAPESGQDYGTKSRQALADKVFRKKIRVEWKEKDRYGRTLGHIYLDDRWINKELVDEGWAWHFKRYSDDEDLAAAETAARKAGVGVWQDVKPIAPWDWRGGTRHEAKVAAVAPRPLFSDAMPEVEPVAPAGDSAVFVTRTGEKYHRSGCRYLSKSKIPISLAEAMARYGPCSVCSP